MALGRWLTCAGLALLSGCWPFAGFVHDETLDGPYRLVAVDVMSDMVLCRSLEGGSCAGDGLPGPTIFAAGANDNYVVLARHPTREAFGQPPRNPGATEYYFLVRTPDEAARGLPAENVVGPLTEKEFEAARKRFRLPAFSRIFDELA